MKNILIIEDEKLIRREIAEVLGNEGYNCIEAADGIEGIRAVKDNRPDLIICDIKMPRMNGHEVLITVREDPAVSSIPFIFLSAMVDKKDLRIGMNLGADDYITKPFTNEELINAVKTRLKRNDDLQLNIHELTKNISQSLPHELRTPLISILGYAQLLMDHNKDVYNDQVYEFAKTIHDAGMRLHHLIQNFICYSRLETISHSPEKLAEARKQSFNFNTEYTGKMIRKISLKYQRDKDLTLNIIECPVRMSNEDFNIMVEEIVDNAFKFSAPDTNVDVKIYPGNENFVFKVTDNGRGMKPEQVLNIAPYMQFERGQFEQQGAGLGLINSKKIAEVYGGALVINSIYGKSTEIKITIPGNHLKPH